MANKKNAYAQKARKLELMKLIKGETNTKGKIGASALMGVKDLVLVVVGGGVIAAISGKVAIPVGFLITSAGHYTDNKILQLLGAGTMAANSFQKAGTVQGLDGLDGVKERLLAYKDSLKEKFFIEKLLKKNSPATSSMGEVQYFTYPDSMNGDLAALDEIENQVSDSAMQFQGTMGETDYEMGLLEPNEIMY